MGYDDRHEIFERLEALERMIRSRRDERGGGDERPHRHRDRRRRHDERGGCDEDRRGGGDRDEKRIIDTIVHLVTENLDRHLQDREARQRGRGGGSGDEKRIVDLIVGLVGERVQEIVAAELDRRLGPPERGAGDEPAGESEED